MELSSDSHSRIGSTTTSQTESRMHSLVFSSLFFSLSILFSVPLGTGLAHRRSFDGAWLGANELFVSHVLKKTKRTREQDRRDPRKRENRPKLAEE